MQELSNGKLFIIVKGIGLLIITSYIFYENIWMTFFLLPYLHIFVKEQNKLKVQQEQMKQSEEFKDGLLAVSFALNVGYSVENAFREASKELARLHGKESKTTKEFSEIVRRLGRNENLEDLLDAYAKRNQIEDIRYFAEVFRFAKRSGGNLIQIIKNTADTMKDKSEVYIQIQTAVSGKRMEQRVMSIVPYCMIIYLKLTSPELLDSLYGSGIGMVVMTVCLVILCVSDYWAKRIVDIEV